MQSKEPCGPDVVDSIRNMSISRRGGVRTRGGRLPPIRQREIAKVTGAKKIIAPKIPQRRIKKEPKHEQAVPLITNYPTKAPQNDDRGTGRRQKAFLQMEGTFLAEGPSAKIKRDHMDFENHSVSRAAKSTTRTKPEAEIDISVINDLLSSYEANEAYEDELGTIPPFRLPLLKEDLVPQVETEPFQTVLKAETETFQTEPFNLVAIKTEIKSDDEDLVKPDIKVFNKIKTECKTEIKTECKTEIKTEDKSGIEEFCNIKDDGMLILLQWPSVLPLADDEPQVKIKSEFKEKEEEPPEPASSLDRIPEGKVGKLQFLKSGRKRLVLGSMAFDVVDGTESQTFKELMSIRMGEEGGDLTVIVNELTAEGKNAIDSPGSPAPPDYLPQDFILDEYEERSMISPASYDDPKLKELISVLMEWINDELAGHRIIVKDIEEDLYDGQILQKLLEKLMDVKLDVVEVTQSEEGQKIKLKRVLEAANNLLGVSQYNQAKWNVESIHSKNVVAILHLLVSLARYFRAPIRLPENVVVNVVVVQKREAMLHTRTVAEELTSTYDDLGMRFERDAFDTLFDHAPDKLQVVKKSLMTFVNTHLNKINLEVTDLDTQFHDGLYLTLLMGLLEGYFVPLYSFNLTPNTFDQKVHNVAFAFELMMDAGLPKPKARPEDIVNIDLKSTLRVLYNLFSKYKHLS